MAAHVVFLLVLGAPAPVEPAKPQESLETAVPHAIKLLEGKKYVEAFLTYGPPEFAKKAPAAQESEVKRFAMNHAADLLEALRQIKGAKPEVSPDGKLATFKLKMKVAGQVAVTWYRHDKGWRIR